MDDFELKIKELKRNGISSVDELSTAEKLDLAILYIQNGSLQKQNQKDFMKAVKDFGLNDIGESCAKVFLDQIECKYFKNEKNKK